MSDFEYLDPHPHTVEMTKTILKQHDAILKMNEQLLRLLAHPVIVKRSEDFQP